MAENVGVYEHNNETWLREAMVIKRVIKADPGEHSFAYLPKWKVTISKWLRLPLEMRYLYELTCEVVETDRLRLNDHIMLPNTDKFVLTAISTGNIIQLSAVTYSNQTIIEGGLQGVEFIVYANSYSE